MDVFKCPECGGEEDHVDDEYGSLAEGGSFEVWRCRRCRRFCYHPMPN